MKAVYKLINFKFTGFVAVSDAVKRALIAEGVKEQRIYTINNAVDPKRFNDVPVNAIRHELGIAENVFLIGSVANLYHVKDHNTLIKAVRELHNEGFYIHLVLAGDGPLRQELESFVNNNGLGSYVHFLGRRQDVERILKGLDAFVMGSHTEGLSNALLEAMAAGKPTVVTAVGGNVEVVVDGVNGMLVKPADVQGFVQAIKKLFLSKDLRSQMSEAGRKHIMKNYSISSMVNSYMKMLREVL
jgi:glycosyltransferase involved in cell wall biosynthesis